MIPKPGMSLLVALFLMPVLSLAQPLIIEFPKANTIYQREGSSGIGNIHIVGRYHEDIRQLQVRFDKGEWETVEVSSVDGRFSGTLTAPVGQGDLSIRIKERPSVAAVVEMVSIGDIYVVAGQSNAAGWADTLYDVLRDLPYTPVVFRRNVSDRWDILRDPASASGKGTPWPLVMSYLTAQHSIPVGVITTAIGGAWLKHWLKSSGAHYPQMINTIRSATNGSMQVRAVLWFQGEADCNPDKVYANVSCNGDYDRYLHNLTQLVNNIHEDVKLQTVYVGQIGNVPHNVGAQVLSNRQNNYHIRKALQDSWELPGVSPGPVTYDIALESDRSHIHFNIGEEMIPFAKRWAATIGYHTYHSGTGRGPRLLDASYRPGAKRIRLKFDKRIKIGDYKGVAGKKAEGWYLVSGDTILRDSDIISTVVRKNTVRLRLRHSLMPGLRLSYGIDHDGDGKKIIRGLTNLPAEPLYEVSIQQKGRTGL